MERGGRGQLADRCRQPGRRVTLTAEGVSGIFHNIITSCAGDTFTIFTELSEYTDWIAATMDLLPPPAL